MFFTNFPHFKKFPTVGAHTVLWVVWDILDAMKIGFHIQKLPKFTKKHVFRVKIGQKKVGRKSTVGKVGIPHFYMP
jgi:hypothetical protein